MNNIQTSNTILSPCKRRDEKNVDNVVPFYKKTYFRSSYMKYLEMTCYKDI